MRKIHVFGGGTIQHVRPHLALCAPAYGTAANKIAGILHSRGLFGLLHMTRMAGGDLETNEDVGRRVDRILRDPEPSIVFMSAALCDFDGSVLETRTGFGPEPTPSGKDQPRLSSNDRQYLELRPSEKVVSRIRKVRKDIFLVGFKTTAGRTRDDQYLAGLGLLKKSSCNLVLANDVHTRLNMVITPEQASYHETTDRDEAMEGLVDMALLRSRLSFTRSEVLPGDPVPWEDPSIPESLRRVVDWCVDAGAYKPFLGSTVGHFAVRSGPDRFVTSRRKTNFNELRKVGMCAVTARPDGMSVTSVGGKPSVGGQSQRIVFAEHPDTDCIVHFHCPKRPGSDVPVRSQREYECGSHECGQNTSSGLKRFDLPNGQYLYAVMLDRHGPNIVFPKGTDPGSVIDFIRGNFDLSGRTDGVRSDGSREEVTS